VKSRNLGKSGLQVSVIGLGCNNFGGRIDLEASRLVVDKALELGITLLDTADYYGNLGGSETILGQILEERRKDVVLATKFGWAMDKAGKLRGASRRYILSAAEASLRRLKTDWIDLYQIHVPDPLTPQDETLRAMDDLVRQGKVRYIGCSNLPAWQVVESQWISGQMNLEKFISCQDEYSLLVRGAEKDLLPAMQAYGLGLLPYFPLASGLLTGKYTKDEPAPEGTRFAAWQPLAKKYLDETNWKIVEKLTEFCAAKGHSLLELAFSWLLSKSLISSVIAGATKPEQVEQNVKAGEWVLTPEDIAEVDRLSTKS